MGKDEKMIIYQVFTRLFGNNHNHCINNGNITENGCGKMADFTAKALNEIKKLGATHIWYTGIIEHATQTDYRRYNIRPDHPAIVKEKQALLMPSRIIMTWIRTWQTMYRSV